MELSTTYDSMDDFQNKINETRQLNQFIFKNLHNDSKFITLDKIIEEKDKRKLARALRWQLDEKGYASSFDQRIFELISKAQSTRENYYRLMMGFPDYVEMWEEWQATENEEDFFKKYGV